MNQLSLGDLMTDAVAKANINKAKTLQDKYKAQLELVGFVCDFDARTDKYIVMVSPYYPDKIYLGRFGAIRVGRTIAYSISKTDIAWQFLREVAVAYSSY